MSKTIEDVLTPFTIRSNGSIGQELLDADGCVVAWTTIPWLVELICSMLTDFTNNESKGNGR